MVIILLLSAYINTAHAHEEDSLSLADVSMIFGAGLSL